MADTICDLYKKKRAKRRGNEVSLLNSFERLMAKLSYTIGYQITVSNGQYN